MLSEAEHIVVRKGRGRAEILRSAQNDGATEDVMLNEVKHLLL